MTEQRPLTVSPSAPGVEPMQSDFHEVAPASHDHTHLALIYETRDELFANVVPFLQAGLERGEQCLYIADETPISAVVEALETAGIDADAAREAGNLSVLSPSETYGEASEFDPAAMVERWEDHIVAANEEGYEGFRIAGEATWELGTDGLIDGVRDYESQLNECFSREDCLAMCMYDRERFSAAVLDDVLQHHPQVAADGRVMQNVYHVPPDEEHPQQTVERKLRTLRERTRAENALEQRTTELQAAHNQLAITASVGSVGLWTWDIQEDDLTADEYVAEAYGMKPANAATGAPIEAFLEPIYDDDRDRVAKEVEEAIEHTGELDTEFRVWNANGDIMWLVSRGEVEYGGGEPLWLHGAIADITERRSVSSQASPGDREALRASGNRAKPDDITERKRQERLQEEQTQLVERIASGTPLEECLSSLCTTVSTLDPSVRASIVLTDDENQSFARCIAPDLSLSWREELEGLPIDERQIGTCGEAVFRGKSITCENVETDDRWSDDWRELCLANDIRAGHSVPIHDADGEPLGSVMLCFDEPKAPAGWEQLADFGTYVASIALERERSRRALRESEKRYRTLFESVPVATFVCDDSAIIQDYNHRAAELWDRKPTPGDPDERYCGSQALYLPDGSRLPHEESPMVEVLQDGNPIHNVEVAMERPDGSRIPIIANFSPLTDAQGDATGVITTFEDTTERKEREQRLARQREQIEHIKDRLLDTSPTGILLINEAGEITLANDHAQDVLGMTSEDFIGRSHNAAAFDFVDLNGEPLPEAELPFEQVRTTGDAVFGVEVGATRPDGQRVWLSINAAPLYGDQSSEPTETVVALDDITARKQTTEALERLNTASRELMDADPQSISDRAADITRDVLDVAYTSLWRYDETTGDLQRHTRSTASGIDPASIRYPEEFDDRAWQTFVSKEVDASNDLPPASDSTASEEPIRSGVILPLGRHGVICAGFLSPGALDATAIDLAETVAATIETALNHAANERELSRQNDRLTRLDQINDIIRNIDQALVNAETSEEIDRVVCERLAQSDRYHSAWIGEYDLGTKTLTPRDWAGIDASYFDDLTDATDDTALGQGPIGTAAQTHEVQVVEDIVTDARFAPWREQTLEYGARACIAIPLVYNEALYSVLTVYANSPQTETDDHAVLGELGETIAHAINAVETKETLHTDSVVELELQFRDPDSPLCRFAQNADCRIAVEGFVPQANGPAHVFVTAQGASPEAIQTATESTIAIEELICLSEREDESLFKVAVADPPLPSLLVEQDAVIRTLTIEDETATAVVDLPSTASVRVFVEDVQTQYPATDLRRRRTRDRPIDAGHAFTTTVDDRLTDRQQDILRTAYMSGFFQSPRERTGKEIAALLDISQPTFAQHLRAGQHNLFELLFDET